MSVAIESIRFDRIANVAIVIATLLVGYSAVRNIREAPAAHDRPSGYARGQSVWVPPGYDYSRTNKTLLIAFKSTCPYCSASIPFYRELLVQRHRTDRIAVLGLTPEPINVGSDYVRNAGLVLDGLHSFRADRVPIAAFPTLIVVNSAGIATQVWVGRLDDAQQKEVMSALGQYKGVVPVETPQPKE